MLVSYSSVISYVVPCFDRHVWKHAHRFSAVADRRECLVLRLALHFEKRLDVEISQEITLVVKILLVPKWLAVCCHYGWNWVLIWSLTIFAFRLGKHFYLLAACGRIENDQWLWETGLVGAMGARKGSWSYREDMTQLRFKLFERLNSSFVVIVRIEVLVFTRKPGTYSFCGVIPKRGGFK